MTLLRSPGQVSPNLLVIGPPKTASTWLYQCFSEHPEIGLPNTKQLHYFDRNYDKGIDWYLRQFASVSREVPLVCEITPDYLSLEEGASRILHTLGSSVQLLIVYRDPAERSYSEFLMKKRSGKVTGDFDAAVKQDELILKNSHYISNVNNYLKYFNRDNINLVSYSELKRNPKGILNGIYKHLGISEHLPESINTKVNEGGKTSRFVSLLKMGIGIRKSLGSSFLGTFLLSTLRILRLIKVWHSFVLKGRSGSYGGKTEIDSIRNIYFLEETDQALSDLFISPAID